MQQSGQFLLGVAVLPRVVASLFWLLYHAAQQALGHYMLVSNREYFQAFVPLLRRTIEGTISGWAIE